MYKKIITGIPPTRVHDRHYFALKTESHNYSKFTTIKLWYMHEFYSLTNRSYFNSARITQFNLFQNHSFKLIK